jgi:hypothetical protein
MVTYTVTLTDEQDLALQAVAADVAEWIQNAAEERARISTDQIVQLVVASYLQQNKQLPTSREAMVQAAYDDGLVVTAASRVIEETL